MKLKSKDIDELIEFLEVHPELSWELTGRQYKVLEKAIREFYENNFTKKSGE